MKELSVTSLSNSELQALIGAAAAELAARATALSAALRVEQPAKPAEPVGLLAPSDSDQRFIKAMLTRAKKNALIRAADKDQYAAIAKTHSAWLTYNEYPTSLRGRAIEDFTEYGKL